jgi:Ca2+-binding EF-hand superfamily protein
MSDENYNDLFDEFLVALRDYNNKQRKDILAQLRQQFFNSLKNYPKPRAEDNSSAEQPADARRALESIEGFLADKLYQLGNEKQVFQRFDNKHLGQINSQQFRAAVALAGVNLTDQELQLLIQKYGSNTTGFINYNELLSYLSARRSQPKSTSRDSYNSNATNRKLINSAQTAQLLSNLKLSEPTEQRIHKGLEAMRDVLHTKKSNPHQLFQSLQNVDKVVVISELIPHFTRLGFPNNLASNEELSAHIQSYAESRPGYLTYTEFLHLFLQESNEKYKEPSKPFDSPALLEVLLKINNSNSRSFFKSCDSDNDGIINTTQLIEGMTREGLPQACRNDRDLKQHIEGFSKNKNGLFSYLDFMKVVNWRPNGQPTRSQGHPIEVKSSVNLSDNSLDLPTIFEALVKHVRSNNLSIESVFHHIDLDNDGRISESELAAGLKSMGIEISSDNLLLLFDTIDSDQSGFIDVAELSRLIINPFRNKALVDGTQARKLQTSVPLGSMNAEEFSPPRRATVRIVQGAHTHSEQAYNLSQQQPAPDTEQYLDKSHQKHKNRPGTAQKFTSSVDFSLPDGDRPTRSARPHTKDNLEGTPDLSRHNFAVISPENQPTSAVKRGQNNKSSIDFSNDHGFRPSSFPAAEQPSTLLHFDPSTPLEPFRPSTAGPKQSVSQIFVPATILASPRVSAKQTHSNVSFNQSDVEVYRPMKSVIQGVGGNSSVSLAHSYDNHDNGQTPRKEQYPGAKSNVDLSFNPEQNVPQPGRRVRGEVENAPAGRSSVDLSHDFSRKGENNEQQRSLRRQREGGHPPSQVAESMQTDTARNLLSSYRNEDPELIELDQNLLNEVGLTVHNNQQRLRHTFQQFNKSTSATLSKENLAAGLKSLNVLVPPRQLDLWFKKFDTDYDDQITYSEFVRLMTKPE